MGLQNTSLRRLLTEELTSPVPDDIKPLVNAIRQRHGTAVVAILFYGACLRSRSLVDGVADFYVIVDSYEGAYPSPWLVRLNQLLPPNTCYLEVADSSHTLRAQYAVISVADFVHAASPRCLQPFVWARFCQPSRLVYVRDSHIQDTIVDAVHQSLLTMIARIAPLLPAADETRPIAFLDLWLRGLHETYRMELRPKIPGTIRALYETAPQRYDRVADETLRELTLQGCYGCGPVPPAGMCRFRRYNDTGYG